MQITVWIDRADWNCCGEPFQPGSQVTWELRRDIDTAWLSEALGPDVAAGVDAFQYHHSHTDMVIEPASGTVARIQAVHWKTDPQTGTVRGSGVLTDVADAERGAANRGELTFEGFLVDLEV
ncbi:DUF6578 domain-containing protein [Actinoplanes sp. NPDC020271]|uniref:DUF6578 domain-containing protein n=1 Tax=Actinoplanes sp. NPDC020271 TaxID=3363896 RepID=UPI00378F692B